MNITPEGKKSYYRKVAEYYDEESVNFEHNYEHNAILQRIRNDFRRVTEQYKFSRALEIGSGPGIDLLYFSARYPNREIIGLDVSPDMVQVAKSNLQKTNASNTEVVLGAVEDFPFIFSNKQFDLIYCYYGALNTVARFEEIPRILRSIVTDDGTLVLTFVNSWYLFDIFWNFFRGRFRKAFSRINKTWFGYSPDRPLPSTCRTAKEIRNHFSPLFNIEKRKGYSIVFPAWYRSKFINTNGFFGNMLWQFDQFLNKTPLWNLGEYSLYVLTPR